MQTEHRVGPLVSVIMPAYNAEKYIEEAIQTVMAQTITDWELIVVDDCSTDATCEILRGLASADLRIRLIRNEVNSGVAKSRNHAMDVAQGQFVAFLDSDDMWYPEKLEKQIALLKNKCADLSYTSYRLVTAHDKSAISDYMVPKETSFEDMLGQNHIGCSTVLMTRELADNSRFTTDYFHEDYVLWLRLLRNGAKAVGLSEVQVDYRYYPTSKAGNKFKSAAHRWKIYRGCLGLSRVRSVRYMVRYTIAGIKKYTQNAYRLKIVN